MNGRPPVLTLLYAPADRPERYAKAAAAGPDVVIIDLEDSVAPAHKDDARLYALDWVGSLSSGDRSRVQVRVNALATPWGHDDLAAFGDVSDLGGVRVPKVESVDDLDAVSETLAAAVPIHALIETALGVEAAYDIARHPRVATIGLGEADLASDLGVGGDPALLWSRGRVVVATRAAGLPPPAMSVYPAFRDDDGLARSCEAGRVLGYIGRAAVHPRQLQVIVQAFRPSADEVARASAVVASLAAADQAGSGIAVTDDGAMVDAAMLGRARAVLELDQAAARFEVNRR